MNSLWTYSIAWTSAGCSGGVEDPLRVQDMCLGLSDRNLGLGLSGWKRAQHHWHLKRYIHTVAIYLFLPQAGIPVGTSLCSVIYHILDSQLFRRCDGCVSLSAHVWRGVATCSVYFGAVTSSGLHSRGARETAHAVSHLT